MPKRGNMGCWFPGASVYVARSDKELKKCAKKLDCEMKPFEGSSMATHTLCDGKNTAFVLEIRHQEVDAQFYALLAHECVHMAQGYFENVVLDKSPSDEFYAYVVQCFMLTCLDLLEIC